MAHAEPWSAAAKCIVLVEDEFLIRMLLSDELREAGYQVIEAIDADEALVILETVTPDLMITDVRMPGSTNGIGLVAIMRERLPELPVIIMSGHLEASAAFSAGASEFMTKPFAAESLIEAVRKLLETEQ